MDKNKERMLPGDYTKKLKYDRLDETAKDIEKPKEFFTFPETTKGNQDLNQKEFLVFYFDDKEAYQLVREFFEIKSRHVRAHPKLDSDRLIDLVKNINQYLKV